MHLNPRIASLLGQLNNRSLPAIDLSLARMEQLLAALGNPERRLPPVIHIAGTNGKGSTLAFLRAIYTAAGLRVHAYTSPHLVCFNERIVLAGEEITDAQLEPLLSRVVQHAASIPVTFFEATTAAAFLAFAETKADVVLLETGLGGRLDATNVITQPVMTVITPIGLDHQEFLGAGVEAIAAEKAGIIKPQVPCIVGKQPVEVQRVLARAALAKRAPLMVHGHGWNYYPLADHISVVCDGFVWPLPYPSLVGEHQYHNAVLAAVVAKQLPQLPVEDDAIAHGITHAKWPARLQPLRMGPLIEAWGARGPVLLDGAHNTHAAEVAVQWIKAQEAPVTLLCGMMRRKDATAFLRVFAGHVAQLLSVAVPGEDSYTAHELAECAASAGIADVMACDDLEAAAAYLRTGPAKTPAVLLITGSLFLAGEVLKNHR